LLEAVMCTGDDCAKLGVVRLAEAGSSTAFEFGGDLLAKFDFGGRFNGDSYPSVSPAQQAKFQADFLAQVAKVLDQLHDYRWLARDAPLPPRVTSGPYRPRTDFHVSVSEMYGKSRSLVPAWSGQRGWMEFPAYRVAGGDASIAHELTHVLFPNGNRMLAEGLAIYIQNKVSPLPVYPNFGEPLEDLVDVYLSTFEEEATDMLWNMNLDAFEQISTPDELGLRLGDVMIGAQPGLGLKEGDDDPPAEQTKTVYVVAGSLVEFLIDNPVGDPLLTKENFGALYNSTPLRPFERGCGDRARWQAHYQGKGKPYSFTDISLLWKTYMHVKLVGPKEKIPDAFARMPLVSKLAGQLRGGRRARAVKRKKGK
jgi:hypothetical protein